MQGRIPEGHCIQVLVTKWQSQQWDLQSENSNINMQEVHIGERQPQNPLHLLDRLLQRRSKPAVEAQLKDVPDCE